MANRSKNPVKRPVGGQTVYKPEYVEVARHACELGHTDADLAHLFGVSQNTIYNWSAKHPEFAAALKAGKVVADQRVERSLYQRAVGYTHPEELVFFDRRADPPTRDGQKDRRIVRAQSLKHVPPDTTAQIFWLKNRLPEQWRDVRKLEQEHTIRNADRYSDDELARIAFGDGEVEKGDGQDNAQERPEGPLN